MLPFRYLIGLLVVLLVHLPASRPALAQLDHPALRLLILQSDNASIEPTKPDGVDDATVPALSTPPARALTAAFIGRRIDDALLAEISDTLRRHYAFIGRPFIAIAIPVQDITTGTLRVNIIETKIGRIKVEGNHWFDGPQYTQAIRLRPGDPIDTRILVADTNWLNRNDNRYATVTVEPTDQPSTYDLTMHAKDRLPLDLTFVFDNTGTPDTGLYRIGTGLDWTNAFWRGDDLSYGFLTTPDQFRLLEHALSYTTYLPWRDALTVSGVIADTKGRQMETTDGMSVNGRTANVSVRYTITLPATPDFLHHIDLGYDFKATNTDILAGGTSVFPTVSELDQFVLGYSLKSADGFGLTVTLVGSPGYLTPRNTPSALAAQQVGASPSYVYGRMMIDRLTNLPLGSVWSARLMGQYGSENLLPSEQLVFGGMQSVRGFMDMSATRDAGILMQNELRLVPINPGFWPGSGEAMTATPFVFLDLGAGRNHLDLAGVRRSWLEMVSTGPGLAWHIAPSAALHLGWGFPLVRDGHTGPILGPQFGAQITF